MDDPFRSLPKVVLHDHLDGGLRPSTVLELAAELGYEDLPATDHDALRAWFDRSGSGSLERYLEAFAHTVGVMQTEEALRRVAYEAVVDLADDGVVYAELRFAPSLHTARGLDRHRVVAAVLDGLHQGEEESGTVARAIVCAMRHEDDSEEVADVALAHRRGGVVAFDLAGPERGFPPDLHVVACRAVREAGLALTLHAGEADGPESIWRALQRCGAQRIGHGVRVADDAERRDGALVDLGPVAAYVRDHQVPLEICVTSNLHTGDWQEPSDHPVGLLHRAGFAVTLNTDNRLMSATSMTDEFRLVSEHHDFRIEDLLTVTERALGAAFCDLPTRRRLLTERVRPGYGAG